MFSSASSCPIQHGDSPSQTPSIRRKYSEKPPYSNAVRSKISPISLPSPSDAHATLHWIYESMLLRLCAAVGAETGYFFYQPQWTVHDIPEPRDPDPIRYAMLACTVKELVRVFSWWIGMGLRRDEQHNH